MFRAVARHLALVAGLTGSLAAGVPTLLLWSRRDRLIYVGDLFEYYLIEVMLIAAFVFVVHVARARIAALAAWIACGAVTVFAIAAGFSIGNLFIPAAALFCLGGLLADLDRPRRLRNHILATFAAGGLQAAAMFALAR